eukprot:scaffold212807_cov18-Tisochrysis_lutea.AAC.1
MAMKSLAKTHVYKLPSIGPQDETPCREVAEDPFCHGLYKTKCGRAMARPERTRLTCTECAWA